MEDRNNMASIEAKIRDNKVYAILDFYEVYLYVVISLWV